MKRIFIGHLGVYGDCLYATTIARQIKHDNPDCHLTWAIGKKYADILDCNPDVDEVIKINEVQSRTDVKKYWFDFVKSVDKEKYDEVYFTQIYPGFPDMYWGSIRTSMFRLYGVITVPLKPVIRLTNAEVSKVKSFAEYHHLADYENVILFECSPKSDQSFLTYTDVMKIAFSVTSDPKTCIILSGDARVGSNNKQIIDGSYVSFRENAELSKYCNLLIGTGSGITQVCQTDWAKELPTIQILNQRSVASLVVDHESLGLPVDKIIETTIVEPELLSMCVKHALVDFKTAKETYNRKITPDFNIIRFHMRFDIAMINGKTPDIARAIALAIRDYGTDFSGLAYFFSTFPASMRRIMLRRSEGVY